VRSGGRGGRGEDTESRFFDPFQRRRRPLHGLLDELDDVTHALRTLDVVGRVTVYLNQRMIQNNHRPAHRQTDALHTYAGADLALVPVTALLVVAVFLVAG
jgi:hypothetical protein